jgi:outer membrane receptor for ferrienterochelin and colicins
MTDQPLENSPDHLAKLNLLVPLMKDKLSAGIEEQYMSRRRTVAGNYAPEFFITNVTFIDRHLQEHLEVSMSIYNLFDKQYGDPVSADLQPLDTVRQDGRSYRVKLTYAF